jgi:methyl-accepting chemotaxis protein
MNLSRTLTRSFGLLLAVLLFLVGFSIYNFRRLAQADAWKVHTYRVLLENHRLDESLNAIDSAVRGFAITARPELLVDYQTERRNFTRHYRVLRELTSDRVEQQQRLELIQKRRNEIEVQFFLPTIAMRRATPDTARRC